jgi:thiol-disulfide isomerase/thioredoxin
MSTIFIALVLLLGVHGGEVLFEGKTTAVVELRGDTFDSQVRSEDSKWIVLFYADWCGHCQHFAPVYTRIAESHRSSDMNFAAVDCASKSNGDLCIKNDVRAYPTIFLFEHGERGRELKKNPTDFEAEVASILGAGLPAPIDAMDDGAKSDDRKSSLKTTPQTVVRDAGVALISIFRESVFRGSQDRIEDLADLVRLTDICARVLVDVDIRSNCLELSVLLRYRQDTGMALERSEWISEINRLFDGFPTDYLSCRDFSCGMWRLLHLITLSSDPITDPMHATRFIVDKYFACDVCKTHFLLHFDNCDFDRCSVEPPTYVSTASWLIRLHNGVNRRLGKPVWPDKSAGFESNTELVNELRKMYGFSTMGESTFPMALVWTMGGFGVILIAAMWRFMSTVNVEHVRAQVTKKYQPLHIV